MNRAIVRDANKGYRLGTSLADIAALWYAGHHDEGLSAVYFAFVDMTQAPIVEAGAG